MELGSLIAAAPWIKKGWKIVPGPLKTPLLVIGAVVVLVRWVRSRGEEPAADTAAA